VKSCTPTCTPERHTATCRQRVRRARAGAARREDADQSRPAYLSDELGLTDEERIGVENISKTEVRDESGNLIGRLGPARREDLLRCIERRGKADGIIEAARSCRRSMPAGSASQALDSRVPGA